MTNLKTVSQAGSLQKTEAYAKINLYLHLFGKREDGYHALESLILPIDLCDHISLKESETLSLKVKNKETLSENIEQENIIIKAVKFFDDLYGTESKFDIQLQKKIPIAAGLGGGSADAASIFRFLFQSYKIHPQQSHFYQEVSRLGADIPACFHQTTCIVNGLGEIVQDFPTALPEFYILLVNPGVSVSTKKIFDSLNLPIIKESAPSLDVNYQGINFTFDTFISYLKIFKNDLEAVACENFPIIQETLSALSAQEKCALSRLSGSGASCYGLFEEKVQAEKAARAIKKTNPDWWVKVTLSKKTT